MCSLWRSPDRHWWARSRKIHWDSCHTGCYTEMTHLCTRGTAQGSQCRRHRTSSRDCRLLHPRSSQWDTSSGRWNLTSRSHCRRGSICLGRLCHSLSSWYCLSRRCRCACSLPRRNSWGRSPGRCCHLGMPSSGRPRCTWSSS